MKEVKFFNFSMFVLRVTLGVVFMASGAQKLLGAFGGLGLAGTAKLLEGLGLPNTDMIALVWAYTELIGGAFLFFGILARWTAIACALVTFFYLQQFRLHYGFFIDAGGIEYDLVLIAAMFPIIFMGGGSWSVWDN